MSEETANIEEEGYSLKASTNLIGQLNPILLDKHGNIIDGFHRKGEDSSWRTEVNKEVDTPFKLALSRLIVNTNRRTVSREEKTQRLEEIYEEHNKELGYYPSAEYIAGKLGRSKKWVWEYLPERFKEPDKVKAGEASGKVRLLTAGEQKTDEAGGEAKSDAHRASESKSATTVVAETPEPVRVDPTKLSSAEIKWLAERGIRQSTVNPNLFITKFGRVMDREEAGLSSSSPQPESAKPTEPEVKSKSTLTVPKSYPSGRMSEHTKSTYTDAEVTLAHLLEKAGFKVETQVAFPRDQFRCQRSHITGLEDLETAPAKYEDSVTCPRCSQPAGRMSDVVDVLADGKWIVEAEGKGSSSQDNEERDHRLESQGYIMKHLPNKLITEFPDIVIELGKCWRGEKA